MLQNNFTILIHKKKVIKKNVLIKKILLDNRKFNSNSHNKIHPESNISKTWLNNLKTNDQN